MILIVLLLMTLIALYFYGTRTYQYWEKRGIKHDKPIPFLGTSAKNFFLLKSFTQMAADAYWKYSKEPVVGFYRASHPQLIIRDPRIVKTVLTKDFQYFHPRGLTANNSVLEPILWNVFFAEGDLWKLLRQLTTPAFTSGKLRAMFPLIRKRAERLHDRVLEFAAQGQPIDTRDLMARYTTDVIGACGFGLNTDALRDENSEFRKLGVKIFNVNMKRAVTIFLKEMFPDTFKHLKFFDDVEKTVIELLKQVLVQRNYKPSNRNDFIDILLECKKKGTIVGESMVKFGVDGKPEIVKLEINDELMAAQMFIFFVAGFETSSSTLSTTLNEIAHNPHVQKKAQEEIDRVLTKYDNKLTYDAVKEMTYLEWALKEGIRVFPPLGFLLRRCTRRYTFKELNLTIDEGVTVMIPLQALHNDPQYFPDPKEFRPERHDPEVNDPSLKYVYMPFGAGPRACMGEYFL